MWEQLYTGNQPQYLLFTSFGGSVNNKTLLLTLFKVNKVLYKYFLLDERFNVYMIHYCNTKYVKKTEKSVFVCFFQRAPTKALRKSYEVNHFIGKPKSRHQLDLIQAVLV